MGTHPHSLCLTEQVERPCKLVPIKHFEQYLPHSECSVSINQVTTRMNTLGGQRSLICFPSNSQSLEHTGHLLVFVELMNGMSTVWESQYISPVPNGKQRHNQTGIIWDGFNKNTTDEDVGWMEAPLLPLNLKGHGKLAVIGPHRECVERTIGQEFWPSVRVGPSWTLREKAGAINTQFTFLSLWSSGGSRP